MEVTGPDVIIIESDDVVQPVANISAELDVVISYHVRPVIYELELARILLELVRRRAILEIPAALRSIARIVDVELRQASIQRQITHVRVRDAELVAQRLGEIGALFMKRNRV